MDEGTGVDVVYLYPSGVLNTVCLNILIEKLMKHRLEKWTARCIENWLKYQVQMAL